MEKPVGSLISMWTLRAGVAASVLTMMSGYLPGALFLLSDEFPRRTRISVLFLTLFAVFSVLQAAWWLTARVRRGRH